MQVSKNRTSGQPHFLQVPSIYVHGPSLHIPDFAECVLHGGVLLGTLKEVLHSDSRSLAFLLPSPGASLRPFSFIPPLSFYPTFHGGKEVIWGIDTHTSS